MGGFGLKGLKGSISVYIERSIRGTEWSGVTMVIGKYSVSARPSDLDNSRMRVYYNRLVGCFGFNGTLRQNFSVYIGPSLKETEKEERKDR